MSAKLSQVEENLVKSASAVLEERGYKVVETTRDSYGCPNVRVESSYGPKTGCVIYPSGRTSADKFEFLVS